MKKHIFLFVVTCCTLIFSVLLLHKEQQKINNQFQQDYQIYHLSVSKAGGSNHFRNLPTSLYRHSNGTKTIESDDLYVSLEQKVGSNNNYSRLKKGNTNSFDIRYSCSNQLEKKENIKVSTSSVIGVYSPVLVSIGSSKSFSSLSNSYGSLMLFNNNVLSEESNNAIVSTVDPGGRNDMVMIESTSIPEGFFLLLMMSLLYLVFYKYKEIDFKQKKNI